MAEKTETKENEPVQASGNEQAGKNDNSSGEKASQSDGTKQGGKAILSGVMKKLTLLIIVSALMGTLVVAGWAAVSLGDLSGSWGTGEVRSDGLSSVIRGEPFVVNLADRRAQHYAQVDYALVLAPGVRESRVRERIPFIQERVTPYFLSRTASELATPEGFEQARRELAKAVRVIYSDAEVERIVVSQLVVQ